MFRPNLEGRPTLRIVCKLTSVDELIVFLLPYAMLFILNYFWSANKEWKLGEKWKLDDIGLLFASGWRHDLEESGNPEFNHYSSAATYDTAFRNSIRCQYLVTFSRLTVTRQHFPLFLSSSVVAGYTKNKLKCASFGLEDWRVARNQNGAFICSMNLHQAQPDVVQGD